MKAILIVNIDFSKRKTCQVNDRKRFKCGQANKRPKRYHALMGAEQTVGVEFAKIGTLDLSTRTFKPGVEPLPTVLVGVRPLIEKSSAETASLQSGRGSGLDNQAEIPRPERFHQAREITVFPGFDVAPEH